jgi:tRNA pseudouridine13 synthase
LRPITHIIGKYILQRDFEKAVMTYAANPMPYDELESSTARSRLEKERDFAEAMKYFPKILSFERSMIAHLSKKPDDWVGALSTLPDNLLMMFVHAYQSYIFNKVLSERIRKGYPIDRPITGDIVLPLNKQNLPDHHRFISVDHGNIEEVTELVSKGLGFVSGVILGAEEPFCQGEMGEIERKIAAMDGISHSDFDIHEIPGLSSKGLRRELLSPVFDLKYRVLTDPDWGSMMELNFSLFKGTYATSFLREIIKGDILDY